MYLFCFHSHMLCKWTVNTFLSKTKDVKCLDLLCCKIFASFFIILKAKKTWPILFPTIATTSTTIIGTSSNDASITKLVHIPTLAIRNVLVWPQRKKPVAIWWTGNHSHKTAFPPLPTTPHIIAPTWSNSSSSNFQPASPSLMDPPASKVQCLTRLHVTSFAKTWKSQGMFGLTSF